MTGADYSDWGERVVSAELRGGLFYAHLSLYELAANFMHGKRVLDAGCGTGYGCAHLMRRGAASVLGVDFSAKAIDYCHQHFSGLGAMLELLDLNQPLPLLMRALTVFSAQMPWNTLRRSMYLSLKCAGS